ncbi:Syntaxin VAM3 [Candida viswanathii]|uniref:Syntaxin VAM3 n=1 Tax=Candida viswanathii TaxID=5486 RepID=A0A367YF37_9ASCO|nr:Syntaxin VAM3 [Candida viswanathii]
MSFANIDLEAQREPLLKDNSNPNYTSPDELDVIINKTSQQLQVFGGLISQFDNQRRQIGTKRDTIELRDGVDVLIDKISNMDRAILSLITNLSGLIHQQSKSKTNTGISNRHMVIEERLSGQYKELDSAFNRSVRIYQEKKRNTPVVLKAPVAPQDSEQDTAKEQDSPKRGAIQEQTQMDQDLIDQTELQYHLLLTEERNREIEQVTEGIMEVNSIFKDLSQLVHQQGEQLNTIEDNVLQLHGNTQQASSELTKANEYQKKRGKWSCILLVALCIFLLVIVLAVIS